MTSGCCGPEQLDRMMPGGRFRADGHVGFERDDARQAQADQIVVVDEQEPKLVSLMTRISALGVGPAGQRDA